MQTATQQDQSRTTGDRTAEEVRADVERTRGDLQRNVSELNERVNPSRVMARQRESVQTSIANMRNNIMGIPDSIGSTGSEMSSSVRTSTQGNPLAAGAIAVGVGWLIGGLLPVSNSEKQKMAQLEDRAIDQVQPLIEKAKEQAQPLVDKANEAVAPS